MDNTRKQAIIKIKGWIPSLAYYGRQPLFQYKDGKVITLWGIAALIREEKKLRREYFYDYSTGLRCFQGVLEGHGPLSCPPPNRMTDNSWWSLIKSFSVFFGSSPMVLNDNFIGPPEERAEYMAILTEKMAQAFEEN